MMTYIEVCHRDYCKAFQGSLWAPTTWERSVKTVH